MSSLSSLAISLIISAIGLFVKSTESSLFSASFTSKKKLELRLRVGRCVVYYGLLYVSFVVICML